MTKGKREKRKERAKDEEVNGQGGKGGKGLPRPHAGQILQSIVSSVYNKTTLQHCTQIK